ncbi:hypothetical protein SmJEL517_g01258 [Synchytrium microbalum]|uniref:Peptidase M48 domain-containing protein n=1 Tax=Synchytrium microbalum TaxID=1806994 RepID=A0A507CAU6_9FUNG|nr:uncharacterized protein SmJEL517_g01258 [Synchytrium microbalum]TPX36581.1 hypothetical protein SmJEL517_g01258 [Synchytrium microbalum]
MPVCQDEPGLAAVLGHEIGHQVARHSAEKLSWTVTFTLPFVLIMDIVFGMGTFSQALLQVGFLLPFSRNIESEADFIGLQLMAQACYDPAAAIGIWERMKKVGGGGLSIAYLSTHPSNDSRITAIKAWLPDAERVLENSDCHQTTSLFNLFARKTQESASW